MNKNDCNIIYDLLPNYVEGLTSEDTNRFVEKHLEECENCKKLVEQMRKDVNNNEKEDTKEIEYLKKFKKKMKKLKLIILSIILVILIVVTTVVGRKYFILLDISNKVKKQNTSDNFRVTEYYHINGYTVEQDYYKLGNKSKMISRSETTDGVVTTITYDYGGNALNNGNTYIEDKTGKYACLNCSGAGILLNDSIFSVATKFDLFKYSFNATITEANYRGKNCYLIKNIPAFIGGTDERLYIEKDTGLMIGEDKINTAGGNNEINVIESRYEYGTLTNADFIEPDLSEYKLLSSPEEYYKINHN